MATKLTETKIAKKLTQLPGWQRRGGEIARSCKFANFTAAMAFVNHVADLAESMDHHPDILVQFNKVTLTLSTHSAGGLTDLDFGLAKKIDALASSASPSSRVRTRAR
jgi:4a-hydroxytetrahydrobiopterin dehydratase